MSAEDLYERMKREAEEMGLLRAMASRESSLPPDVSGRVPGRDIRLSRSHGGTFEAERQRVMARSQANDAAISKRVSRSSCFNCGTRADVHGEFGCGQFIGGVE